MSKSSKNVSRASSHWVAQGYRVSYTLTLCIQGPFLSQQTGTLRMGMDAAMQRYRNQPVINGSLIRGNLRYYLMQIKAVLPEAKQTSLETSIKRWFGQPSSNDFMPLRASIQFDTFWLLTTTHTPQTRTRIQIDPTSGTVAQGALQVVEDYFPSGEEANFQGKLRACFNDKDEAQRFEKWVNKALELIPALGSLKGVGYGRLIKATLKPNHAPKPAKLILPQATTRFGFILKFDQPFCVGRPKVPTSNRVESDTFITGNIIKGALAQLCTTDTQRQNDLNLDQLIISHAQACSDTAPHQRNPAVPLSLMSYQNQLYDVALQGLPIEQAWQAIPSFQSDWKSNDWAKATQMCQLNPLTPQRLLQVRTKIHPTSRSAEEGNLFSLECVDPQGFSWVGNIDLSAMETAKRAKVLSNLLSLLDSVQGKLDNIGKTKATATFTPLPDPIPNVTTQPLRVGDLAIITLMSDARLLPRHLEQTLAELERNGQWQSHQLSDSPLHHLYTHYWQNASQQGLQLVRYFARQERRGSAYTHHHFQKQQAYFPEWLTLAGSVFVVHIENTQGLTKLQQWACTGLPASAEADGSTKPTWQTTPYLPENGFGEIVVNWNLHFTHAYLPEEGSV